MINEDIRHIIKAGNANHFSRDPNDWIFVDIGFGGRKNDGAISKTTGIKIGESLSKNVTWAQCVREIITFVENRNEPLNLMLEAPLSVAFDITGNPAPRAFEKTDKGARYWYVPMGTNVAMSALFLLGKLKSNLKAKVNLYESIVSFKPKKTDHAADTDSMYDSVVKSFANPILDFAQKPSDIIESSATMIGWDFGIPPVFVIDTN